MCSTESSNNRAELAASAGAFVAEGTARAEQCGMVPADREITLYVMSVWEVCCNKCGYRCSGCVGPMPLSQGTIEIQVFANARPFLLSVYNSHASK